MFKMLSNKESVLILLNKNFGKKAVITAFLYTKINYYAYNGKAIKKKVNK